MKETFIIRTEWYEPMKVLSDEQRGVILTNLMLYHRGENNLINLKDNLVNLVWGFIEPNLRRNAENYDRRKETSRENGLKGGRKRKELGLFSEENPEPNSEPKKPNETLNDSVSVSESVSDSDIVSKKKESPLSKYPEHLIQESEKFKEWSSAQMPILLNKKQKEEAQLTYLKLRSNGYSKDQVKEAIIYATTDEFWKMNFRVPSKLIKKDKEGTQYIDVFLLKAKAKVESQPKLKEYNPHVA